MSERVDSVQCISNIHPRDSVTHPAHIEYISIERIELTTGEPLSSKTVATIEQPVMKHIPGSVYSKLPRAGPRSLGWMMLGHPRLGAAENCAASTLNGNDLVLNMITQMSLIETALDTCERNCDSLVKGLNALLFQDDLNDLVAKIDNAVIKDTGMFGRGGGRQFSSYEGVLANLEVICHLNEEEKETMRHVLLSSESLGRCFRRGPPIPLWRGLLDLRRRHRPPHSTVHTRITKYVSDLTCLVQFFSKSLVMLAVPSGSSGLVRVIAKGYCRRTGAEDELIEPSITQKDRFVAPVVLLAVPEGQVCMISLYNLNGEDLALSGEPIEQSMQMQGDTFRVCDDNCPEVPNHDCNVVLAHGFGRLKEAHADDTRILRDVEENSLLTFVLQSTKDI